MLVSLWSLKGGVGCSVTAALLAINRSRRRPGGCMLVDLGGDQPAILGVADPPGPGLADWLGAPGNAPPDGLARLAEEVSPGLTLVWRGRERWPLADTPAPDLAAALASHPGAVVVDAGSVVGDSSRATLARGLVARSGRAILVTRACYLELRRAELAPVLASGVVVLREPRRSLGTADVAEAVGAPVLARIDVDPTVARAVDAGLLLARSPVGLGRALEAVA